MLEIYKGERAHSNTEISNAKSIIVSLSILDEDVQGDNHANVLLGK